MSVIILNYNVQYFLELCLKSVQAAIVDLDAEIIVVDNQSSDDSCEMVRRLFPEVILIQNEENFGFSKGNNIGVTYAKGEYLCILNPDTVVPEDAFKILLAHADHCPNLGIIGCQLIDGKGDFLPESKRNIPTPIVAAKKILGWSKDYYANHLKASDIGKVDILVGAFMLLKKNRYTEVGGFDEDYFIYGEDIDLSYKVLKAGYQNIYYGKISLLHYKGESTLKDKIYAKRFYGAMHIFYKKHFKGHPIFDLMVRFTIVFSRFLSKETKEIQQEASAHAVMTNNTAFNLKFPFPSTVISDLAEVPARAQIVFDGNTMDYKSVIGKMMFSDKDKGLTFRILPPDSQFIIGSDSSRHRGEVILL